MKTANREEDLKAIHKELVQTGYIKKKGHQKNKNDKGIKQTTPLHIF